MEARKNGGAEERRSGSPEERKKRRGEDKRYHTPLPALSFPFLSLLPVLALSLTTLGCDADMPAGPGLPDSLMVEVLIGVHLADARASRTGEPRDSLRAVALAELGTDTLAFHRALDYYAHRPEVYQPLYDRALDRLLDERRGTPPAD